MVPLYVSALPSVSTAVQNVVDAHDTVVGMPVVLLKSFGEDHVEPLKTSASPALSTATQKVADTQETETIVTARSATCGVDHVSADVAPLADECSGAATPTAVPTSASAAATVGPRLNTIQTKSLPRRASRVVSQMHQSWCRVAALGLADERNRHRVQPRRREGEGDEVHILGATARQIQRRWKRLLPVLREIDPGR